MMATASPTKDWPPPPTSSQIARTRVIAMAVRNALEDMHGGGIEDSLTDEQMARINPLVRNAILEALHSLDHVAEHERARRFVAFQVMLLHDYWEEPALTDEYVAFWGDRPEPDLCRRCGRPVHIDTGGRWTHSHPDGSSHRGCRAASFQPDHPYPDRSAWDESLPRGWKALGPGGSPR